jgi:hypothetical protein
MVWRRILAPLTSPQRCGFSHVHSQSKDREYRAKLKSAGQASVGPEVGVELKQNSWGRQDSRKSARDPEEKFLPFTFRPEIGPTIRTLALCLVLHYENALPLRISARIGSSI